MPILDATTYAALRSAGGDLWAVEMGHFIAHALASRAGEWAGRRAEQAAPIVSGAVAVLSIAGLITPKPNDMGGTSTELLAQTFKAAIRSDAISAVMLHIDSPGGSVYGVQELAQIIFGSRGSKPIVAVVNCMAASAAYWLGSQADALICTPSGDVGSIGVFSMHEDYSKALEREGIDVTFVAAGRYKTEASPYEPLSDEARAAMQARVNGYYTQFVADVARGRGKTMQAVKTGFGEGRLVRAPDALKSGMVDQVLPFDQSLQRLVANVGRPANRSTDMRATAELREAMALPTIAPPDHFSSVDPDTLRRRLRLKIHSDN